MGKIIVFLLFGLMVISACTDAIYSPSDIASNPDKFLDKIITIEGFVSWGGVCGASGACGGALGITDNLAYNLDFEDYNMEKSIYLATNNEKIICSSQAFSQEGLTCEGKESLKQKKHHIKGKIIKNDDEYLFEIIEIVKTF